MFVDDAGAFGGVGEGAVAIVVEEVVGFADETARAAHDGGSAELAGGVFGGVGADASGHVEVDVAGDVEIEAAVAVVVAPGGAGGPGVDGDTSLFGDVGEGAVVVVAVEAATPEVRDEEVGPAIVIEVADDGTEAPAIVGDAGFSSDVGEGAVVVVVEESGVGGRGFAGFSLKGGAVDEIDVEPAVVVVVEQSDAGADSFNDGALGGSAHCVVPAGEAGFDGDVFKDVRASLDEAAGGDGAMLAVEHGIVRRAGVDAHAAGGLGGRGLRKGRQGPTEDRRENEQGNGVGGPEAGEEGSHRRGSMVAGQDSRREARDVWRLTSRVRRGSFTSRRAGC